MEALCLFVCADTRCRPPETLKLHVEDAFCIPSVPKEIEEEKAARETEGNRWHRSRRVFTDLISVSTNQCARPERVQLPGE